MFPSIALRSLSEYWAGFWGSLAFRTLGGFGLALFGLDLDLAWLRLVWLWFGLAGFGLAWLWVDFGLMFGLLWLDFGWIFFVDFVLSIAFTMIFASHRLS